MDKTPTKEEILDQLKTVPYPGYSRDIVSFGLIKEVQSNQGAVNVRLEMTAFNAEIAAKLKIDCVTALQQLPGFGSGKGKVFVEVKMPPAPQGTAPTAGGSPFGAQNRVPGIQRIIAVASGKGGVGKSTCAANLACALQQMGARVGLLDCDIYGPSIPLMMGIHERPQVNNAEKLIPPSNHGVKLMSMGFLLDGDTPVIWRGPMIMKTVQQFLLHVDWGTLDYLLVDLPPGTGDAQLSLCQTVPLDGGVIVTTPQEASLGVVRKGIAMFLKVQVPILGLIENMSYFTAPSGERVEIFGHGGGKSEAERQSIDFLGEIPIYTEIRECGDRGVPAVVAAPKGAASDAFRAVATALHKKMTA